MDCTDKEDATRNRQLFEFICPTEMCIVEIEKCKRHGEHPCAWEVTYMYKYDSQKTCNEQNAKKAFEDILQYKPSNVMVHTHDQHIIGNPPKYRITYNIISCNCPTQDFEMINDIIKNLNNTNL